MLFLCRKTIASEFIDTFFVRKSYIINVIHKVFIVFVPIDIKRSCFVPSSEETVDSQTGEKTELSTATSED